MILAVDGDKTNQYYWMKDHEWKVLDAVELFTTKDVSKDQMTQVQAQVQVQVEWALSDKEKRRCVRRRRKMRRMPRRHPRSTCSSVKFSLGVERLLKFQKSDYFEVWCGYVIID